MNAPIMRVNTINPQSVIPGPAAVPTTNNFQVGVERQQAQQDRVRKQEKQDFDFEQDKLKAERAPYEEMMRNPAMADMIAQQYGITIDDNIRTALKKPAEFDALLKGGQAAAAYGISNPKAKSAFAAAFMRTGSTSAAMEAVQGMALEKPAAASYSHIKSVDGSLVDVRNGSVVYQGQGSSKGPTTTGMPAGYHFDRAQGKAVPIPGTDPSMYVDSFWEDPRLSPQTRAEYEMLKPQLEGDYSPPEVREQAKVLLQRAMQEIGSPQGGGAATPPTMAPAGAAPAPSAQPTPQLDPAKQQQFDSMFGL